MAFPEQYSMTMTRYQRAMVVTLISDEVERIRRLPDSLANQEALVRLREVRDLAQGAKEVVS